MYQNVEICWKYNENKADWRVQWGMPLKMCNKPGQKGCLKVTGIVFAVYVLIELVSYHYRGF